MVAVPINQVNLSQFSGGHNFATQHSYSLKFCRFLFLMGTTATQNLEEI